MRAASSAPAHMRHGSRVTTSVQSSRRQLPDARRRRPQGEHLGVGGGIVGELAAVVTLADDVAMGVEDDGSYGHVAHQRRRVGELERPAHRCVVLAHETRLAAPRHPAPASGRRGTFGAMELHVADHPLVRHKITVLRDKTTPSSTFRLLVDELVTLLAYEATRNVRVEPKEVETPLTTTVGTRLADPVPLIVPILRAGLGMLDGMTRVIPSAEVGFLGLKRDEETLRGGDVREPSPRPSRRAAGFHPRPDARYGRVARGRDQLRARSRAPPT